MLSYILDVFIFTYVAFGILLFGFLSFRIFSLENFTWRQKNESKADSKTQKCWIKMVGKIFPFSVRNRKSKFRFYFTL